MHVTNLKLQCSLPAEGILNIDRLDIIYHGIIFIFTAGNSY